MTIAVGTKLRLNDGAEVVVTDVRDEGRNVYVTYASGHVGCIPGWLAEELVAMGRATT